MSEMVQEKQDLTTGSLGKKILLFSLPLMASNLLQVLFNMADVAVVGTYLTRDIIEKQKVKDLM